MSYVSTAAAQASYLDLFRELQTGPRGFGEIAGVREALAALLTSDDSLSAVAQETIRTALGRLDTAVLHHQQLCGAIRNLSAAVTVVSPSAVPRSAERRISNDDDGLIDKFLCEADDLLSGAEHSLRQPRSADSPPDIANVFRAFHTIKGVAGMLHLDVMYDFARRTTVLLSGMRDGQFPFDDHRIKLVFCAVEALRSLVASTAQRTAGQTTAIPDELETLCAAIDAACRKTATDPDSRTSQVTLPFGYAPQDVEQSNNGGRHGHG